MFAVILIVAIVLPGVFLFVWALFTAPIGWEDESGFHYASQDERRDAEHADDDLVAHSTSPSHI